LKLEGECWINKYTVYKYACIPLCHKHWQSSYEMLHECGKEVILPSLSGISYDCYLKVLVIFLLVVVLMQLRKSNGLCSITYLLFLYVQIWEKRSSHTKYRDYMCRQWWTYNVEAIFLGFTALVKSLLCHLIHIKTKFHIQDFFFLCTHRIK
jgi:hypothetical protein